MLTLDDKLPKIRIAHSRGFTLFEILIAVFVIAVGLLGIAGLQVTSKHANYEAVQRTTASMLADDIIERMRANPTALSTYTNAGAGKEIKGSAGNEPTPKCDATGTSCSGDQVAAHDLWEWQNALNGITEQSGGTPTGGLVSPVGCITGPAGGAGSYNVAIVWRGQTALTNASAEPCGLASAWYGDTNEYRRVLVIPTYISP